MNDGSENNRQGDGTLTPAAGDAVGGAVSDDSHRAPLAEERRPDEPAPDLEMILDVPVTLSVEIGRTRISIRDLLQLTQGSVVELDRLAGEPLDVLVNDTLVAHGEVVVANEKYGIRLTNIVSRAERVGKLKEG